MFYKITPPLRSPPTEESMISEVGGGENEKCNLRIVFSHFFILSIIPPFFIKYWPLVSSFFLLTNSGQLPYYQGWIGIVFALTKLYIYLCFDVYRKHRICSLSSHEKKYNILYIVFPAPRVIPPQNIVLRLYTRQLHGSRYRRREMSTGRGFYTNVYPNFTLVNVEKPPCFLRKFTPDGKKFIAFRFVASNKWIINLLKRRYAWFRVNSSAPSPLNDKSHVFYSVPIRPPWKFMLSRVPELPPTSSRVLTENI